MKNNYVVCDGVAMVEFMLRGVKEKFIVDAEDLPKIKRDNRTWTGSSGNDGRKQYVVMQVNKKRLALHNEILGKPPNGYVVDHINGNKLDNRKCNLRFVTLKQNAENRHLLSKTNSSGHRGISQNKQTGKWTAYITNNGHRHHLGYYSTLSDAIQARTAVEKMLFTHSAVM